MQREIILIFHVVFHFKSFNSEIVPVAVNKLHWTNPTVLNKHISGFPWEFITGELLLTDPKKLLEAAAFVSCSSKCTLSPIHSENQHKFIRKYIQWVMLCKQVKYNSDKAKSWNPFRSLENLRVVVTCPLQIKILAKDCFKVVISLILIAVIKKC